MRKETGLFISISKFITTLGNGFLLLTSFFALRVLSNYSFSGVLFLSLFLLLFLIAITCFCRLSTRRYARITRNTIASLYTVIFVSLCTIFIMGWRNHGFHTTSALIFSSLQESSTLLGHDMPNTKNYPSKKTLFIANMSLTLQELLHKDSYRIETTKLLNYSVSAFHYPTLRYLFQEIFLARPYAFIAHTEEPHIIDCGSNIGLSVLFFKTLYPKSSIIAFEADSKTYELLHQNIVQNKLENVTALNKAVSESDAPLTLKEQQTVQATTLSKYIDKPVDFLKMDIHGAELGVIRELAHRRKLSLIQEMVINYHHHIDKQDQLAELLKILELHGFGYQISACLRLPSEKNIVQDILIYVYKKIN